MIKNYLNNRVLILYLIPFIFGSLTIISFHPFNITIINLNKIKNKKVLKYFKFEFDRLWIHGLVHLLGHDHKKDKDFLKMRQIEKKYFDIVNV